MKNMKKTAFLVPAVLLLAAAAWALRRELYAVAVDEKNLLVANHPLELALWAVVLAGTALIGLTVRKLDGSCVYEDNFQPSALAGLGHFLMAYAIGMMVLLNDFQGSDRIALIQRVLGIVAVPGLLWGGISRMRGKKPFFLIHGVLCLFLLLNIISRYQSWSGNPQLQDYVFELLAAVALILFSYHCAAFEAGIGKRRGLLAAGLLAVLLCGGALADAENPGLYAGGAVLAMTNLCRLDPPPKKVEVDSHDPA